jgi:hypothetical protein
MSITVVHTLPEEEWRRFVEEHPQGNVFHTVVPPLFIELPTTFASSARTIWLREDRATCHSSKRHEMTQDDIKYMLTAATLKLFSISPQFYRFLGNIIGTKKRVRAGLPKHYPRRAKQFLTWCEKHRALRDGDKVLEIGTGWVHWESIVIRLFYDVEATLFDVWDNRQLEALKRYFGQLEGLIGKEIDMDETQKQRIHRFIEVILRADSFDDLCRSLGFRYVIDERGTLDQFQDESFDFIYSYNVLQHVDRSIVFKLIQDFYLVLKPGGFSIHLIDLGDMLVYFAGARNMSEKNYLRYSDEIWRRYFENKVQYFNRIQRPEWLNLFHRVGFELVEEETRSCNIDTIKVAKTYEHLERSDLECKTLLVVHRKPHWTSH